MTVEAYTPGWRFAGQSARTAANVTAGEPLNVALIANGKPNSGELLDALAHHIGAALPVADVRSWRKHSVSVAPTPEQFDEITAWADVALVAIGD